MNIQNATIVAVAALLLILERRAGLRRRASPLLRAHVAGDVLLMTVGFVALARLTLSYVSALGQGRLNAPLAVTIALTVVLLDLGNYIAHVALHASNTLWTFHKVHHSSPVLDWLATFRAHAVEQVFRRLVTPGLLIAVGMPAQPVMIGGAVFIAWAMLNHSNLDVNLRFLEPVLITPRLHHIHHLAAGGDRNLGTIFTFWDRLRGRLDLGERPAEAPLGVPGEPNYPQGLWLSMREPFKRRALRGPDGVDS